MKNTSSFFPFIMGRCPAVPSAQKWQKPVGPRYTCLLSWELWSAGKGCSQRAVPPTWKQIQLRLDFCGGKWQQVLSSDESNVKYLAVAKGSLFNEGLEGGRKMSVCRCWCPVVSSPRCLEKPSSPVPVKLCAGVGRRIDTDLKAKGGPTKYWVDLVFYSIHLLI